MGDTHTAALVARDGSVDWLCLPRFDSPAIFAALLDTEDAGHWSITVVDQVGEPTRSYTQDTLILETTLRGPSGAVTVTDLMPLERTLDVDDPTPIRSDNAFLRLVRCDEGTVDLEMTFSPRFGYGRDEPTLEQQGGELRAEVKDLSVSLRSEIDLEVDGGTARGAFSLAVDERKAFVLQVNGDQGIGRLLPEDVEPAIETSTKFWRSWLGRCTYGGMWAAEVRTSLLTLKGLTYSPTGGIVAAPTTSLPEDLGGVRNWDYRFCWLRDATFTLDVLLEYGFTGEAVEWRNWLLGAIRDNGGKLQPLFDVRGGTLLPEQEIDWLKGYENSKPVRIGNAASEQFQLDIYGEILDAMHSARRAGLRTAPDEWELERRLIGLVLERWMEPDAGIWEVRGPQHNFVHSKVMAWVALDRGIKAVEVFGLHGDTKQWRDVRDVIRNDILANGVDEARGTFKRSYEDSGLDASLLMLPMVGFVDANDDTMRNTIDAIEADLVRDGFVMRYLSPDGLPGDEGTFLLCTCWLVDNLVMIGREDDARAYLDRVLGVTNDLGLLAEMFDVRAGRLVGNFPQAFSHIAVAAAAMAFESRGQSPTIHREAQWK